MRFSRVAVPAALAVLAAGCGGSSAPPAGQTQAAAACKTGGTQAASLAAQAAQLNPRFATLSTDEAALAASEAQTQSALSDGSDGGASVTGATGLGTPGSIKVITDCTSLGLSVMP
jgi:hypothetical protein